MPFTGQMITAETQRTQRHKLQELSLRCLPLCGEYRFSATRNNP
jgi:hypothetical protein